MSISPFARREESSAGCENDKRINAVMYSNKCSGTSIVLYRPRDRGINRSNKPGWKIETSIRIATLFVSGERGGIRRRLMMQSATKRGEKGEARRGGGSFQRDFWRTRKWRPLLRNVSRLPLSINESYIPCPAQGTHGEALPLIVVAGIPRKFRHPRGFAVVS